MNEPATSAPRGALRRRSPRRQRRALGAREHGSNAGRRLGGGVPGDLKGAGERPPGAEGAAEREELWLGRCGPRLCSRWRLRRGGEGDDWATRSGQVSVLKVFAMANEWRERSLSTRRMSRSCSTVHQGRTGGREGARCLATWSPGSCSHASRGSCQVRGLCVGDRRKQDGGGRTDRSTARSSRMTAARGCGVSWGTVGPTARPGQDGL